jgi:uncharacterized protein (DUF1778 family)
MEQAKDSSTLVQMRLQPKTMDRIERLSELTGTKNRTQIIAAAIELAEEVIRSQNEGTRILFERPDGTKERLKIIGI